MKILPKTTIGYTPTTRAQAPGVQTPSVQPSSGGSQEQPRKTTAHSQTPPQTRRIDSVEAAARLTSKVERDLEVRELKPITIDVKQSAASKAFLAIADVNVDEDFRIIDTYA